MRDLHDNNAKIIIAKFYDSCAEISDKSRVGLDTHGTNKAACNPTPTPEKLKFNFPRNRKLLLRSEKSLLNRGYIVL